MEDVINRLFAFMEYKGLKQNKFEIECGLTHSNLREKKQGPTADYFVKIVTRYPEINLDWLIAGRGNMLIQSTTPATKPQAPAVNIENIQTINIGNWSDFINPIRQAMETLRDAINNK